MPIIWKNYDADTGESMKIHVTPRDISDARTKLGRTMIFLIPMPWRAVAEFLFSRDVNVGVVILIEEHRDDRPDHHRGQ